MNKMPLSNIDEVKETLQKLTGNEKLAYLLANLKRISLHSSRAAEALIDENLSLVETARTEEAAVLLGQKAFYCFQKDSIAEAHEFTEKALSLSREIGSNAGEAKALMIKGYLEEIKRQHKKASSYYMLALEKSSKLHRSNALIVSWPGKTVQLHKW